MADFTLLIRERVLLEGTERGTDYNLTIKDVDNIDNRIVNCSLAAVIGKVYSNQILSWL